MWAFELKDLTFLGENLEYAGYVAFYAPNLSLAHLHLFILLF